ncbi:MAG: 2-methylcitrate synthase, partial [Idiomarinaceae bacterium]|nr:2-methylcitrate synthase [Idiomarinaceae bacterium]
MVDKKLGGAGLRGQVAGETKLCTVGKSGSGLTYYGYDIKELAEKVSFEEVAYLLAHGELPKADDLAAYKGRLAKLRGLPQSLKDVLERIPADAHPMDVMRTGCSFLGNIEPEEDFSQADDKIERLLAAFPSILLYWYHFSHNNKRIETETDADSIGAHFLELLHGKKPSQLHADVMNTSLILYAE